MKEIEGYPGYFVTEDGRVWSEKSGIFMTNCENSRGYFIIPIRSNGKRKTVTIHRLVAQAFLPNPYNHPVVMHINNIKTDNRVENLKWGTQAENVLSAWEDGLCENIRSTASESNRKRWAEGKMENTRVAVSKSNRKRWIEGKM